MLNSNSLRELQIQQWEFASKQFPDQTIEGKVNHLTKELKEVLAHPGDIIEHADCLLIFLALCSQNGHSTDQLIEAAYQKLEICKTRKWGKMDEQGVVEHDRSSDAPVNEEEFIFLRPGDIYRAGDVLDGHSVGLNSKYREGGVVLEHDMALRPRRFRGIPLGEE